MPRGFLVQMCMTSPLANGWESLWSDPCIKPFRFRCLDIWMTWCINESWVVFCARFSYFLLTTPAECLYFASVTRCKHPHKRVRKTLGAIDHILWLASRLLGMHVSKSGIRTLYVTQATTCDVGGVFIAAALARIILDGAIISTCWKVTS